MFIPLATTASSPPSLSTPPLDDGITAVKHYIYLHSNLNPRTFDTTKKYYFHWHDNIKCQSHSIYNNTCAFRCCPEVCGYCNRSDSNKQGSKNNFLTKLSQENAEGIIQGNSNSKSPFSWDANYTEWY